MSASGRRYAFLFWVWIVALVIIHLGCGSGKKHIDSVSTPIDYESGYKQDPVVERLLDAAVRLERRNLIYSSNPKDYRDCSGIFHRLMDMLEDDFPHIQRPPRSTCRSSGTIAGWFGRKGGLIVISDPLTDDRHIREGTIMFYGKQRRRYSNPSFHIVVAEAEHIGVVVRVARGAGGRVDSYELFHGRSRFKPAKATRFHTRIPTRPEYPPLGNGNQQWIACSNFISVKAIQNGFKKPAVRNFSEMNMYADSGSRFVQTGMAAWYGVQFDGKPTASGEPFDSSKMTGAHPTLPFGTRVSVTNLENNKSVVIRINDRGPYSRHRIIDLSESAAEKIGMIEKGTVKVKVEFRRAN